MSDSNKKNTVYSLLENYSYEFEQFLEKQIILKQKSPETLESYSKTISFFIEWIDANNNLVSTFSDITHETIDEFIQHRSKIINETTKKEMMSASTRKSYKLRLNAFFTFIAENSKSPLENKIDWKKVKAPDSKKRRGYLDDEVVIKIMEYLENLYVRTSRIKDFSKLNKNQRKDIKSEEFPYTINLAFKLGIYGGMRASEICSIRLKDFDVPRRVQSSGARVIRINIFGKGRKERIISLPYDYVKKEKSYFENKRKLEEPILRSITNKILTRRILYNYIIDVGQTLGIDGIFVHLLRHTAGFRMSDRGVGLAHAQDFFGHSIPEVTRIYYKYSEKAMDDIAERMMDK